MKKTNYLKTLSTAMGLIFGLSFVAIAAPDIYLTKQGSVILNFGSADGYTLNSGDVVLWQKFDAADQPVGPAIPIVYSSELADVALNLTGSATELETLGLHYYKAAIITADPANCGGDVSDAIEIYRLPDLDVMLLASLAEYCAEGSGGDDAAVESVLTANTNIEGSFTLPTEVLLNYGWSAEKNGVSVDPISGLGTALHTDPTAELVTTFTMNTSETGKYDFIASVQYSPQSTDGIIIKGASIDLSDGATVTVTPKPGKPVITIE